jgi:hypothetical protein
MAFGLIIQRRSQVPSGGWPEWIGIPGRNESEQVAGINRNQWPECAGIRNQELSPAPEFRWLDRLWGVY